MRLHADRNYAFTSVLPVQHHTVSLPVNNHFGKQGSEERVQLQLIQHGSCGDVAKPLQSILQGEVQPARAIFAQTLSIIHQLRNFSFDGPPGLQHRPA